MKKRLLKSLVALCAAVSLMVTCAMPAFAAWTIPSAPFSVKEPLAECKLGGEHKWTARRKQLLSYYHFCDKCNGQFQCPGEATCSVCNHVCEFKDFTDNGDGTHTGICICHKTLTEGHAIGYDIVEPTCVSAGTKQEKCEKCNYRGEIEELPKIPHDLGEWYKDPAPTCGDKGVEKRDCQRDICDYSESRPLDPTGDHQWGDWEVTAPSTCIAKGVKTRVCGVCGAEDTDESDLADHTWGEWRSADENKHNRVCTVEGCGAEEEKYHVHQFAGTVEPICEDGGKNIYRCNDCGHEIILANSEEALGHDWNEWHITKAATTTEEGEEAHECRRCGKVETREIPMIEAVTTTAPETEISETESSESEPAVTDPTETEPTVTETSSETTTEEPVVTTAPETQPEEPIVTTAPETQPEEPVVTTAPETQPEEPVVTTALETQPEEPAVTTVPSNSKDDNVTTASTTAPSRGGVGVIDAAPVVTAPTYAPVTAAPAGPAIEEFDRNSTPLGENPDAEEAGDENDAVDADAADDENNAADAEDADDGSDYVEFGKNPTPLGDGEDEDDGDADSTASNPSMGVNTGMAAGASIAAAAALGIIAAANKKRRDNE